MKIPKAPKVRTDIWRALYEAAAEFRVRRPWRLLDDDEIFAVKSPVTGETGYCCVLGAAGQMYALCMYRGGDGLALHRAVQQGDIGPGSDDIFAMQNVLMAEFCTRQELEKEDRAALKSIGFRAKRSEDSPPYPCFRDYAPGFPPWFISTDGARWLTFALRCGADFADVVAEGGGPPTPPGPDRYLTYLPAGGDEKAPGWTREWMAPEPPAEPAPPAPPDELRLQRLAGRALEPDSAWEIDVFYMPEGVIKEGRRPYFARTAMAVQAKSGFVCNFEMIGPERSFSPALQDVLLGAIETHGRLPGVLNVRNEQTREALQPLADALEMKIEVKRKLSAIREARESLELHLSSGG